MKRIFFLFLFLAITSFIYAQVQMQWQKCLGGSLWDVAQFVQKTNEGGYIVAGYSESINGDVTGNHGNYDVWVAKIDNNGNLQWQKSYGGSSEEKANCIKKTSDGGYVIAGYTNSYNGDVSGNNGSKDMWVVKIDNIGNIQWQKCLGGSNNEIANAIQQTTDGGYIVAGNTFSVNGNVSGNHGNGDMWVVKLNNVGNIQWSKCLGGINPEIAYDVKQTVEGGYIVAGYANSYDGDVAGNHGAYDMWVVKLDATGTIQWQKCLGGSGYDEAYSIQLTNDGGYVVAGYNWSGDGDVIGNNGNSDFWVVKLNSSGNIEWQNSLGGSTADKAFSVQQTNDGGYVVAGFTISNDGDVSGNHSASYSDMWVVKLDSIGNIQWQKCLGGSDREEAYSIQETTDGGFVVIGYTNSNDGDVSGKHGYWDMWAVKIIETNISGVVFLDVNHNGIKDIGEAIVAEQMVKLEPGPAYTYTNNNGKYYFYGDTGNYIISYVPQPHWYSTTTPYNINIDTAGQIIDSLDIGVYTRDSVNDVSVYVTGAPTRVGFETHYWLTYKNWGTINASGTVNLEYDPVLTYNTSTDPLISHIANVLTFDYNTLGPGEHRTIRADFQIPATQQIGNIVNSNAWVTPLIPDTNIINNYDTLQQVITSAYDPNDKLVTPAGIGPQGYVLHGERLSYTIRFQNTGNDTAFTVVLRDTINDNLDPGTLVIEAWSHDVTWELHSGNEIFFRFNNILLPDSNVNEPESHGFIRYSISPKPGLADGTTASNTTYIFFDYNPAVVTNTTLNTFVTNIPVNEPELQKTNTEILAFPNPSRENIYINLPEFTRRVQVYNTNGEMVKEIIPQKPVAEINIQALPAGIYAVRIYHSGGVVTTKFVKE